MQGEYGRRWLKRNRAKKTEWAYFDRLKKVFGLSRGQHAQMLVEQDHKCAICGMSAAESKRRFAVDHDHETNQVRGLLCHHCNTGLGAFMDTPDLLQRAIDYLKVWGR